MALLKKLPYFLICILVFSGCDTEKASQNNDELVTSADLLTTLSNDRDFDSWTADFHIWTTKKNEIVVFDPNKDVRNLFILQGASSSIVNQRNNFDVLYLKHGLVLINQNSGEKFYLGVPKPEEEKNRKAIASKINFDKNITGHGLIYGTMTPEDFKDGLNKLKEESSIIEYFNNSGNNRSSSCTNGGVGSTSCSNGGDGCSVSCGSGYYACCNTRCSCQENPVTQD